ncbi:MAG TPA: FtsQ-type POTRA domain-containing protein [Myxococcaceae bacterium]|nr:FtsQ-type POTRA domain-containing protein [Myxococcaceae bacterium]
MSLVNRRKRRRKGAGRLAGLARMAGRVLWASALLVALALAGRAALAWLRTSPRFALKTIAFSGTTHATHHELLRVSGLSAGQNLFQLDAGALERSVCAHPWVREAKVTRHFPGGVSIRVEEHRPVAVVSLGELYLLDDRGEPFKKLQADDALDLPLVTGVDREEYVKRPESVATQLRQALDIAAAYAASEAGRGEPLSEIRLTGEGVTLVTGAAGREVHFGESATQEKLDRLARIRAELQRRGVEAEVIHLDNRSRPGWVAVKLQTTTQEPKPAAP